MTSVFYIYLLKENFEAIPDELYQAAKVDGTSDLKYLVKVMIPICQPTVVTIIILKVIECWNNYVWPRLITYDANYYLVSNGIQDVSGLPHDESLPYNRIAALGVAFHDHFRGVVPVSLVNGILTPELARYVLRNDLIDTVDLARGLLADPALAEAILTDAPYSKCFDCKRCGWGPGHSHACPALARRDDEAWEM